MGGRPGRLSARAFARRARQIVVCCHQLLQQLHELAALLDVHLMLLEDEMLTAGVKHWVRDRLYNAEWALTTQFEIIARQFDEMEDDYLRERKADLEQVVERVLRRMLGAPMPVIHPLVALLHAAPHTSEALAIASGRPLSQVLATLTELELEGQVICENGRWLARC